MSNTTVEYCATIFTIGHHEPIGIFRGSVDRLVALGFVRPCHRGRLELTERGNHVLARIDADEEIADRDFGDWMFSFGQVLSPCTR